jgi:hypothetical protein
MTQIFIENILSPSLVTPPVEVNNLLSLMRYNALEMRYIINHHSSLVLGDNQYDYYVGTQYHSSQADPCSNNNHLQTMCWIE